ncbi:MAG: TonB-dependent receptor, partial [Myxococcota bacterium]
DINGDGVPEANCSIRDALVQDVETRNIGAFVQDSWNLRPNLTINAGLRWEQQSLFNAENLRGQISSLTGEAVPDTAFELSNMLAPRLGVIYDWTEEGRSRLYGHWGRFYESIPMQVNAAVGGGGGLGIDRFFAESCDFENTVDQANLCDPTAPNFELLVATGEQLVAPGLKPQYLDEWLVGAEYEVLANLKLGVSYTHRELGRVIEDITSDTGVLLVANPSEADADAIRELRAEAAAIADSDPITAARLRGEADIYESSLRYDVPSRTYDALQLTLEKRFSHALYVRAAYTYSRLNGNYPGLFAPETDTLAPNLTSAYDRSDLMTNRTGPLALDRPHVFQLDGYYTLNVQRVGSFVFGTRVRAQSGTPVNYLATSELIGNAEAYLLPRGSAGSTSFSTRFDIKVAFGRPLSKTTRLDAFIDVFNIFDQQPPLSVDNEYTLGFANSVSGGDENDLAHIKE